MCRRVWCLLDSRCEVFHQKTQLCSSHTRGQICRVQWISSMLSWTVMVTRWNEKYNGDTACMTPFSWPRWLQEKHGIKINSWKKITRFFQGFSEEVCCRCHTSLHARWISEKQLTCFIIRVHSSSSQYIISFLLYSSCSSIGFSCYES